MSKPAGKHIIVAGSKGQLIAGNGTPLRAIKFLPNSPCRCKSGKKTKRCCGTGDVYRNTKPNRKVDAQLKKEGFTKMQLT